MPRRGLGHVVYMNQMWYIKQLAAEDSRQQEGIPEILEYLREDGDVMPYQEKNL